MEPPSSISDLARQLLASSEPSGDGPGKGEALVSERLRASVTSFAGTHGFAALLRRALVLATAELPVLGRLGVDADGRLEGVESLNQPQREEAALVLTTHVLSLLVTFVGEPLTRKLARLSLSETSVDETNDQ